MVWSCSRGSGPYPKHLPVQPSLAGLELKLEISQDQAYLISSASYSQVINAIGTGSLAISGLPCDPGRHANIFLHRARMWIFL